MDKNNVKKGKKPYRKPKLEVLDLAADEVLAIGCKTPTTNPADSTAAFGCFAQGCSAQDGS